MTADIFRCFTAGMTKKKISYEQALALEAGRRKARANQRRRAAAVEIAETVEHVHSWSNWEYVLNYSHEVRECPCGYAEIRPVRL